MVLTNPLSEPEIPGADTNSALVTKAEGAPISNYDGPEILDSVRLLSQKIREASEHIKPPAERLEELEQIVRGLLNVGGKIIGYSWFVVGQIVSEGLWREARDRQGQPYKQYWAYVVDLWESCLQAVSPRTIFSRISQMEMMRNLNISQETQIAILSDSPSIGAEALSIPDVDPATGDFIGLQPKARESIIVELGLDPEEAANMDDAALMKEMMERIPELPHGDASDMVRKIRGTWRYMWRWLVREKTIMVKGSTFATNEEEPRDQWRIHLKLIEKFDELHPDAKKWLEHYSPPTGRKY